MVCNTILGIFWGKFRAKPPEITTSLSSVEARLSQLEKDHANINQLAESTKKLLSEANLVKGLRPQR